MIAGNRHGPGVVTGLQLLQKAGGIFHVHARVQHAFQGRKVLAMIEMIDLHAAQIDQPRAGSARLLELLDRLGRAVGEDGSVLRRSSHRAADCPLAGLGEPDGVEHSQRHAIYRRGAHHFPLAQARLGAGHGGWAGRLKVNPARAAAARSPSLLRAHCGLPHLLAPAGPAGDGSEWPCPDAAPCSKIWSCDWDPCWGRWKEERSCAAASVE